MRMTFTKRDIFIWISLYILFIMHGSNALNTNQLSVILPLTVIAIFFFYRSGMQMTTQLFIPFTLLLINHIITGFLSGAGILEGFNFSGFLEMLFVIMAIITLYKMDNDVMTKFIKLVFGFSVISLIFYLIISIGYGNIITSIFKTYKAGMGEVSGKYLYAYNLRNADRNAGIFSEPGIYQVILIMCCYVILFLRERISLSEKQCRIYLIVFLITLITTRSAAGYIGLLILAVGALLKRKENRDYLIIAILLIGVLYLLYDYYTHGTDSILQQYFFGKLVETQERSLNRSSGGARLLAVQMGIQSALQHPFGIGYLKWENQLYQIYGTKFGTGNALFTQLGTRGFIAFFISIYLVLKPAFERKKGWIEFVVFAVLFFYVTVAQSKLLYPAIIMTAYLDNTTVTERNKLFRGDKL